VKVMPDLSTLKGTWSRLALMMSWGLVACTRTTPPPTLQPTLTLTSPPAVTATPIPTPTQLPEIPAAPELPPISTPESPVAPELPPTPTPEPQATLYTVQPGDTLLDLALRWGVPMAALQLANDMGASTALQAGQPLLIPPVSGWEGASPFWVVRPVAEGDTLLGIAAQYGLDFTALVAVNELTDADVLAVGQPLILPLEAPLESVVQAVTVAPAAPTATTPAVAAVTVATPPPAPAVSTAPPSAPSGDLAAWAAETFRLINEQRAAYGIPPYTWNDTLALAAQLHGEDCQAHNSWSHTGSDGSRVKDRVLRAGYPAVGAAECFVYAASPQQAVAWWMDEVPPDDWHRRTLLSTWVTEVGVAVIPDGRGGYYFFADFGRPK
jgi:uncharacterized protein YkwD